MSRTTYRMALVRAADLRPGDTIALKAMEQVPCLRVLEVSDQTRQLGTSERFVEVGVQSIPVRPITPLDPPHEATRHLLNADALVWAAVEDTM